MREREGERWGGKERERREWKGSDGKGKDRGGGRRRDRDREMGREGKGEIQGWRETNRRHFLERYTEPVLKKKKLQLTFSIRIINI